MRIIGLGSLLTYLIISVLHVRVLDLVYYVLMGFESLPVLQHAHLNKKQRGVVVYCNHQDQEQVRKAQLDPFDHPRDIPFVRFPPKVSVP